MELDASVKRRRVRDAYAGHANPVPDRERNAACDTNSNADAAFDAYPNPNADATCDPNPNADSDSDADSNADAAVANRQPLHSYARGDGG